MRRQHQDLLVGMTFDIPAEFIAPKLIQIISIAYLYLRLHFKTVRRDAVKWSYQAVKAARDNYMLLGEQSVRLS
ncbi:hypothetical protein D3C87_1888480 [compost metagenome]